MTDNSKHIIFFGEVGSGKSSAINLLLDAPSARVSNDSQPCTQAGACYETTLNGRKYNLWDTRGLGEGRSIFRAIFGGGSEKDLKKFLKERYHRHEIDLLVYCVRGSRATKASVKYYDTFCAITRRLVAPVVIVVTHSEKEEGMENWWKRNASSLMGLKMEFDNHACITTLPGPQLAESKKRLIDLITTHHRWEAKESGSYFGSSVQKSTLSVAVRPKGGLISRVFKGRNRDGAHDRRPRNDSGPSTTASFHTAESPAESVPPSPVVVPPTPCSETPTNVLYIDTSFLGVGDRSQSSEETSSTGSSSHSMFYTSSQSSYTSHSDVQVQSYLEGNEDCLSKLPFKHSTATIRRRKGYATQGGAFGDVWECDLISGESSRMIAVKAVKTSQEELGAHRRKLRRELRVWGRLRHRNVVPLLGVVSGFGPLPSMMLKLSQRHCLLADIAAGLCYLHSQDVIHGDLHSGNVLIDENGTACLTDFGLSFVSDFVGTSYLKSSICGGVRFADPALVQRVNNSRDVIYPTKPCDVYSFGGLMLHVLSGKKPYDGICSTSILLTVLKGERPQIPTDIHPLYEPVIRRCWNLEEGGRPSAADLAKMFDR